MGNESQSLYDQQLSDATDYSSLIYDGTSDIMALIEVRDNDQFLVVSGNRRMYEYLNAIGLKKSNFLGKKVEDFLKISTKMSGRELEESVALYKKVRDQKEKKIRNRVFNFPNNTTAYFENSFSPILNKEGECIHILYTGRDVTESQVAKIKLAEGEAKFRNIFENSPLGIVLVDPDSNKIIQVNQEMSRLMGYSKEELTNMSILDITYREDIEDSMSMFKRLQGGEISKYSLEKRYVCKNKKIIWGSLSATIVRDENGKALYALGMIKNIDEIKAAELRVKESEEMLSSIYNNTTDLLGLLKVTPDNDFIFISGNQKTMESNAYHGIGEEDFVGMRLRDFVQNITKFSKEETDDLYKKYRNVVKTKQPVSFETDAIMPNGAVCFFLNTVSPVLDANGKCTHVLFVTREITKEKEKEEEIAKNQEQLSLIYNSTNDLMALCSVNEKGKIHYQSLNRPFLNTIMKMGTVEKEADLIGKSIEYVFSEYTKMPSEDIEKRMLKYKSAIEGKKTITYESTVNIPVTGDFHIETSLIPILNDANKVNNLLIVVKDITERKEQENELLEKENKLSSIYNTTNDSMILFGLQKDGVYIESINEATEKKAKEYGLTPPMSSFVKAPFREMLAKVNKYDKETIKAHEERIIEIGRLKETSQAIEELDFPNGKIYLDNTLFPIIEENGECKYVLYSSKDITAQVEYEKKLEKTLNELKNTNIYLENLAYMSSHDLKSPISALEGIFNLITTKDAIKDDYADLLEMANRSIERLNKTIQSLNDVLAFKESLKAELTEISFDEILHEVTEGIDKTISATNTRLKADFSKCAKITFPPVHLKSIFQNMITNAIKYKKLDSFPEIFIESEIQGDYILLTFKDNGMGMNIDKVKDKIFNLFKRFHDHVEGSGVGLYMVNSIVTFYGGHIEVKSKEGSGTIFKVFLKNEAKKYHTISR